MNYNIKRVYLGLPANFKQLVVWVDDEFRTNALSLAPGGSDVIVEYQNSLIFGYDKIKHPSMYIRKFWYGNILNQYKDFENYNDDEQLKIIKADIHRVYARKYEKDTFETEAFKEIWNSSTSTLTPWKELEAFDIKEKNSLWKIFQGYNRKN